MSGKNNGVPLHPRKSPVAVPPTGPLVATFAGATGRPSGRRALRQVVRYSPSSSLFAVTFGAAATIAAAVA